MREATHQHCSDEHTQPGSKLKAKVLTAVSGLALGCAVMPSEAVDGCTVLLCLAAPSWRSIEQCVPPVRQVLRDLALGRSFPTCAMAGAGNAASHAWSAAPDFCPPQYTRLTSGIDREVYTCDYDGAISVTVDGALFARTWWSMSGDSVTDFSPAAKTQLGTWDSRFDDEFAAWLASQSSAAPQN